MSLKETISQETSCFFIMGKRRRIITHKKERVVIITHKKERVVAFLVVRKNQTPIAGD